MKWTREFLYVARNAQGVVVGVQELKPHIDESEIENDSKPPSRRSSEEVKKEANEINDQIREYARQKKQQRKKAN